MNSKEQKYKELLEDCLAGALTILHYEGILNENKSLEIIENNGLEGLFDELDRLYKLIDSNN